MFQNCFHYLFRKQWNQSEISLLIQLYRQNDLLWDPLHKDHINRSKKAQVVEEIATILNTNSKAILKKWRSLNTQFRDENKTQINERRSGAGAPTRKQWYLYESLSFLKDKFKPHAGLEAGLEAGLVSTIIIIS